MNMEILICRLDLAGVVSCRSKPQNQTVAELICQPRSFQSRSAPVFREARKGRSVLVTPIGHEQRRSKHAGRNPHAPIGDPHRC